MEIIGFGCAMLVGISLGVLGSGGSILTVPIMVYLLGVSAVDATGYSLFVVGLTSAVGCATYIRKKLVDIKVAVIFGVPSILCVFFTRKFLMPVIPDPVFSASLFVLPKDIFIMLLYAVLMITVACTMILKSGHKNPDYQEFRKMDYLWLSTIGLAAGLLAGVLGVGGGFIIVPALVLVAKLPIRMSVGTSLLIIAFNSLGGFSGEIIEKHAQLDYSLLLVFAFFSVAGIFVGLRLTSKLYPAQLKRLFGWFVLVMGVGVFLKEILFR